jgi:hypothetical protein
LRTSDVRGGEAGRGSGGVAGFGAILAGDTAAGRAWVAVWTWFLAPALLLLGALLVAVALVEGPPLPPFLYAVF